MSDPNAIQQFDKFTAVFELVFSLLSLLGSGIMVKLLSEEEQRRQVRPRLLLVLGSLDMVYAFFTIVSDVWYLKDATLAGGFFPSDPQLGMQSLLGTGYAFVACVSSLCYGSSLVWTCCLGAHMFYVVVNGMCNEDDERSQEKIYHRVQAAVMCFILLPIFGFVYFDTNTDAATRLNVYQKFWAVWEITAFATISAFCLFLLKIEAKNPSARKYQQQLRQYLIFFLVFMTARVLFHVQKDMFTGGVAAFFASLWALLGASNAMVWGVSRTCLLSCVNKCLSTDVLTFLEPQGGEADSGFFGRIVGYTFCGVAQKERSVQDYITCVSKYVLLWLP
jgi:hypothetical protein